jgi:hypothetical protein
MSLFLKVKNIARIKKAENFKVFANVFLGNVKQVCDQLQVPEVYF